MATTTNRLRWQPQDPCAVCGMANDQPDFCRTCAASLARVVQQDGIWPGLTAAGARLARRMATEDGEVQTSDSPTLALHQRLSLAHPVAAGRYDTLHPDLAPFWQWVAMKQARENPRGDFIRDTRVLIHVGKDPGVRMMQASDEAMRQHNKLAAEWRRTQASANTPTGAETP